MCYLLGIFGDPRRKAVHSRERRAEFSAHALCSEEKTRMMMNAAGHAAALRGSKTEEEEEDSKCGASQRN